MVTNVMYVIYASQILDSCDVIIHRILTDRQVDAATISHSTRQFSFRNITTMAAPPAKIQLNNEVQVIYVYDLHK